MIHKKPYENAANIVAEISELVRNLESITSYLGDGHFTVVGLPKGKPVYGFPWFESSRSTEAIDCLSSLIAQDVDKLYDFKLLFNGKRLDSEYLTIHERDTLMDFIEEALLLAEYKAREESDRISELREERRKQYEELKKEFG